MPTRAKLATGQGASERLADARSVAVAALLLAASSGAMAQEPAPDKGLQAVRTGAPRTPSAEAARSRNTFALRFGLPAADRSPVAVARRKTRVVGPRLIADSSASTPPSFATQTILARRLMPGSRAS